MITSSESRHLSAERHSPALSLTEAWESCADLFCRAIRMVDTGPSQVRLERELIFCLLGGFGIPYELADSATEVLLGIEPFDRRWNELELQGRIHDELSTPQ